MTLLKLPEIALSVRQPWAWAIIHGGKDIENRGRGAWSSRMVGRRIAIHASRGMTRDEYDSSRFIRGISGKCPAAADLVRGGIIGAVTLTAIVCEHDSPWFFGPRGLVLTDAEPVDPIPATGQLGYFRWQRSGALAEPLLWMTGQERRKPPKRHREPTPEPEPEPLPLLELANA